MNYSYENDFIDDGVAVHRYDYDRLNQIDPDAHFDDLIRWIVRTVKEAAQYALNLAVEENREEESKKIQQWRSCARQYATPVTEKKQITWPMLCCRYGYAIEQYVNEHIANHPFREFSVSTQERNGHTIPDIVVRLGDEVIAWVDITSEKSVCHINKKRGSGWTKTPVVIELAYPALTFSQMRFT